MDDGPIFKSWRAFRAEVENVWMLEGSLALLLAKQRQKIIIYLLLIPNILI